MGGITVEIEDGLMVFGAEEWRDVPEGVCHPELRKRRADPTGHDGRGEQEPEGHGLVYGPGIAPGGIYGCGGCVRGLWG